MHNIKYYKKLNGRCPLEISEKNTRIFQNWDFIFGGLFKAPGNSLQPEYWMGFAHSTGDEMCYYIKIEEKKQKKITISVIRNRHRHVGIDKEYTNGQPNQAPEINDMELGFINS